MDREQKQRRQLSTATVSPVSFSPLFPALDIIYHQGKSGNINLTRLDKTTRQFNITRDCVDGRVSANHGKVTVIPQECRTAKCLRLLPGGKKHQELALARAGISCAYNPFHAQHS